ncbi:hypothetical protein PILCRDRAFT_815679 [Piloderma croceum F 1598]|uniref:Carboxylesterase type B domain-containing protein n=1 Tax=Piloderma croceum (strain F 1598) TaxID=765440 RepID=A0A0C3G992_PILCF|nr:hypothetical protein PILCRDRAFT_815679 [Piloderma croceum F 1598]
MFHSAVAAIILISTGLEALATPIRQTAKRNQHSEPSVYIGDEVEGMLIGVTLPEPFLN